MTLINLKTIFINKSHIEYFPEKRTFTCSSPIAAPGSSGGSAKSKNSIGGSSSISSGGGGSTNPKSDVKSEDSAVGGRTRRGLGARFVTGGEGRDKLGCFLGGIGGPIEEGEGKYIALKDFNSFLDMNIMQSRFSRHQIVIGQSEVVFHSYMRFVEIVCKDRISTVQLISDQCETITTNYV